MQQCIDAAVNSGGKVKAFTFKYTGNDENITKADCRVTVKEMRSKVEHQIKAWKANKSPNRAYTEKLKLSAKAVGASWLVSRHGTCHGAI